MTPQEIEADVRRLLREIDIELQTLAVAIKRAPPERQKRLAQLYFRHVLFMAKQNRVMGNKITSLQTARTAKSSTSVVERRALQLIAFQRKQLRQLGEHLHRLNLALAKESSSKKE